MNVEKMTAILNATCHECAYKYTDWQRLEHFGTPCKREEIGCDVIEGDVPIEECPAVQQTMEDEK